MSVYVICYAYNTLCIFEYIHLYVYEKLLFTYTHEKLLFTYTHTYIYKWKISKKTSEPKAKLMTHQRVKLYSSNVAPRMLAVENLRMSYRECSLLVPKFNHRSSPACGTFLPLGSASLFSVGRQLGPRFWARSPMSYQSSPFMPLSFGFHSVHAACSHMAVL